MNGVFDGLPDKIIYEIPEEEIKNEAENQQTKDEQ